MTLFNVELSDPAALAALFPTATAVQPVSYGVVAPVQVAPAASEVREGVLAVQTVRGEMMGGTLWPLCGN